jgi:surface polysaccharide O-acyltransferase-like enzyme
MFLNSFNHFRAIAIIFIVAGHSFINIQFNNEFDNFIRNIISGSTTLFVFISGFLFHHIFYKKYEYKKFIIGKIKNVYIPYIIMGLIPLYYTIYLSSKSNTIYINNTFIENLIIFFKLHFNGTFFTAYWYIPFIMIIFILSPLFIKFINAKNSTQIIITSVGIIMALFIHRSINNENLLHSVIYFMPIYLLGIVCSIHKDILYKKLKGKDYYLLSIVIILALIQSICFDSGNYHKDFFDFNGIDLMYLQKIALALFFMVFLNKYENYHNKFIHKIASASFAIFFIHPYIIYVFLAIKSRLHIPNIYQWIEYTFLVILVIILSLIVSSFIKFIFKKYSRFIIGY